MEKELSLCHKLKFSFSYIFNIYRSTTSGWSDIGIRKSEFVAKTQFLSRILNLRKQTTHEIPWLKVFHNDMFVKLRSQINAAIYPKKKTRNVWWELLYQNQDPKYLTKPRSQINAAIYPKKKTRNVWWEIINQNWDPR